MRRPLAITALTILCLLLTIANAFAQIGTAAPLLEFPLSARVRAMGDNGAADNSDPGNIHFNPANSVGLKRIYIMGALWNVHGLPDGADVLGVTAGFSNRTNGGFLYGIDLSYGRLGFGDTEFTPTYVTPIGPAPLIFEPTNETFTVAFGAGHSFGDGNEWRVGFARKRFWSAYPVSLDTNSITIDRPQTYANDFGASVAFRLSCNGWNVIPALGLAYVNDGSDITSDFTHLSDPLPARLHFGGNVRVDGKTISIRGADVPLLSIIANVDVADRMDNEPSTWGMGAEIGFAEALFLRGGFTSDPGDEDDRSSTAWGAGVGIPGSAVLRFDYAHTSNAFEPDIYGLLFAWRL